MSEKFETWGRKPQERNSPPQLQQQQAPEKWNFLGEGAQILITYNRALMIQQYYGISIENQKVDPSTVPRIRLAPTPREEPVPVETESMVTIPFITMETQQVTFDALALPQ